MNYPKIFRIPVPDFKETRGKHYLSVEEVKELLDGVVTIEEKIDGKIDAERDHYQIVFFEFMKYKHTIPYFYLPSFKMVFDVYDEDAKKFLNWEEKYKWLTSRGYFVVREIFHGETTYEELLTFLPKILAMKSAYGEKRIEGIIVKNYKKQLFGKIVNPEFEEEMDGGKHWTKKKIVLNRLQI